MLKAHKYRIFPTNSQQEQLAGIFGQIRFVYNLGLETKISTYAASQKNVNCFELNKQITELKKDIDWLNAPSQALQMAMRNLDNAYHGFFRGGGFPKFKSKHSRQSFQLPQGVRIAEDGKKVFIPKLKWVDIDLHRDLPKGDVKTVTVSKTTTDKYFISILVDTKKEMPRKKSIKKETSVGVDLGIKDFAITSDGMKFESKDFMKSTMRELRIAQRSLARRQKGSKGYERQRKRVALLHEKVRNQRQDYLHKISSYLVNSYNTICIEDLDVSNMVKNRNLARAISDQGWREFRSMLEYKASWHGKNIQVIGRFDPSSKTCSHCGNINKELNLSDREWACSSCGVVHDRDVNAAINIKNFGLRNQPRISQREPLGCA
jgi:putative transposase